MATSVDSVPQPKSTMRPSGSSTNPSPAPAAPRQEESGDEEGGVWFYGPYDRQQTAQLKLHNGAHRPVAFRLKCNRATHFHIKPSGVGVLQPNEFQLLALTALPRANELHQCALLLELVPIIDPNRKDKKKPTSKVPAPPLDPITAWNHVNLGNLKKTAIPIYFGQDALDDGEEEIVVVLINETMMTAQSGHMKRMLQRVSRRYPDAWWFFIFSLLAIMIVSFVLGILFGMQMKKKHEK